MKQLCHIHVLHIASGDLWAGAEVQLYTLAKALRDYAGVTISVVLMNHGMLELKLQDSGIHIIVLDESKLNGFQVLYRLKQVLRELKPDIIHTHRSKENILGSFAAWLSGGIPSLRTSHGANEHTCAWYQAPKHLINFLDWFCGQFLQKKVISVSYELAKILEGEFSDAHVKVIENGIDLDTINNAPPSSSKNTPFDEPLRVGIAGRLVPVKRVDLFIESAYILRERYPETNVEFYIYGTGPLLGPLKKLNQQLKTENIVHFEGHCDDILSRLRTLDMLLMTSDHEGLPMILLEAMSQGTPIVAHGVGGITRLLDNGNAGVLIDDHCAASYADAIYDLATHHEKRDSITQSALQRVRSHYSAEQNALLYCEQYQSLMET